MLFVVFGRFKAEHEAEGFDQWRLSSRTQNTLKSRQLPESLLVQEAPEKAARRRQEMKKEEAEFYRGAKYI